MLYDPQRREDWPDTAQSVALKWRCLARQDVGTVLCVLQGRACRNGSTHTGRPADLVEDLMSIHGSSVSLSCIEWAYSCTL